MAEALKHALWLRPFGDAAYELKERIKKLSEKYETPLFEPHVTLLSGLRRGETELIQLTETLAGSLSPFEIELGEPGYRDHYYRSFFLHVKKTDALIDAQQTAEKLFGCSTDETYLPHLSLMYGEVEERHKRMLVDTMGSLKHAGFPVHSLLLIQTEGGVDDWKKIHTAEFKRQ